MVFRTNDYSALVESESFVPSNTYDVPSFDMSNEALKEQKLYREERRRFEIESNGFFTAIIYISGLYAILGFIYYLFTL